ncbi:MAG: UPF0182 family protein [Deltaproteobacteria bacterium]|nr:UPF0182 family protein [Deltaproteobacteria bacterium]
MRQSAAVVLFATLLVVVVVSVATVSGVLVDWLWFDALGFGAVFITMWKAKLAAFGIAAGVSGGALAVNGLLAACTPALRVRRLRLVRDHEGSEGLPDLFDLSPENFPWRMIVLAFATVLGLLLGLVLFRSAGYRHSVTFRSCSLSSFS